jgi:hypothetical protein
MKSKIGGKYFSKEVNLDAAISEARLQALPADPHSTPPEFPPHFSHFYPSSLCFYHNPHNSLGFYAKD